MNALTEFRSIMMIHEAWWRAYHIEVTNYDGLLWQLILQCSQSVVSECDVGVGLELMDLVSHHPHTLLQDLGQVTPPTVDQFL